VSGEGGDKCPKFLLAADRHWIYLPVGAANLMDVGTWSSLCPDRRLVFHSAELWRVKNFRSGG